MAVRRLRIRRCNCLGLNGNLHLPGESLCVGFAYPNGNGNGDANRNRNGNTNSNGQTYSNSKRGSYTAAASDTRAPAVTLADSR